MSVEIKVDIRGRVANIDLKPREALLPLYEAVVNSMHAIEDADRHDDSRVEIRLIRNKSVRPLTPEGAATAAIPIRDIEIIDNGVGFNRPNFESFLTSDSTRKSKRGGKGVGRFLWLKAFESVQVESTYNDGQAFRRRTFGFSLEHPTIVHDVRDEEVDATQAKTRVRLERMRPDFEAQLPRTGDALARRLLEHVLKFFVLRSMPSLTVIDDTGDETIRTNVNDEFDRWVKRRVADAFSIGDVEFQVEHFLLDAQPGLQHKISFCGNDRVVEERPVDNRLPNLPKRLQDAEDSSPVVYSAYVSSDYLDGRVNQSRTEFSGIAQGPLALGYPDELSFQDIAEGALEASRRFLEPYTEPVRDAKKERIRRYITEQAPQYRPLLKRHADRLESIPADLSDNKLDTALYEIDRGVQVELRHEAREILERGAPEAEDQDDLRGQYSRFLEDWNDFGKANLTRYIVHRKVTLELLKREIARDGHGNFALEKAVHKLVFPLNATSDTVDFDLHNLWLLDEKLAYHYYLASDVSLRKNDALGATDLDRPDLLILNHPVAVVDGEAPYSSGVVVVEFKRPMRDDYDDRENPIQQVYDYVRKIRAGEAHRNNGRTFQVTDATPFFCYVVCDITKTLRRFAERAGLQVTPDQRGYFGWNPSLKAYVEILDFDKLVSDAEKRNAIMFDKLNLSAGVPIPAEGTGSRAKKVTN